MSGLQFLRPSERFTDVFGYLVKLDVAEQIQCQIFEKRFEPTETTWVDEYLKPGMTFIDVGANVGYYSLLAARSVGAAGRVFSFEPSPYSAMLLRETIERNRIEQIIFTECALGEREETRTLMLQDSTLHSPTLVPVDNVLRSVEVPVIRLDGFLQARGITHVDLLKVDVEGFEPNVIRGAGDTLQFFDAILCELNPWWLERNDSSVNELHELISSRGFKAEKTMKYETHEDILFVRAEKTRGNTA